MRASAVRRHVGGGRARGEKPAKAHLADGHGQTGRTTVRDGRRRGAEKRQPVPQGGPSRVRGRRVLLESLEVGAPDRPQEQRRQGIAEEIGDGHQSTYTGATGDSCLPVILLPSGKNILDH